MQKTIVGLDGLQFLDVQFAAFHDVANTDEYSQNEMLHNPLLQERLPKLVRNDNSHYICDFSFVKRRSTIANKEHE